jgi:hypothetical protein
MGLTAEATDWLPIHTAPRDGTLIWISDMDGHTAPMRWNAERENGLFPGVVGFWELSDGSMTWNEEGDLGPTHWRPIHDH